MSWLLCHDLLVIFVDCQKNRLDCFFLSICIQLGGWFFDLASNRFLFFCGLSILTMTCENDGTSLENMIAALIGVRVCPCHFGHKR